MKHYTMTGLVILLCLFSGWSYADIMQISDITGADLLGVETDLMLFKPQGKEQEAVTLSINSVDVHFNEHPVFMDSSNHTMVPLNNMASILGINIDFDSSKNIVILSRQDIIASIPTTDPSIAFHGDSRTCYIALRKLCDLFSIKIEARDIVSKYNSTLTIALLDPLVDTTVLLTYADLGTVPLGALIKPDQLDIGMPIKTARDVLGNPTRTERDLYNDEMWVYVLDRRILYLSHRNGIIQSIFVIGDLWRIAGVAAQMQTSEILSLYPTFSEQSFTYGNAKCTLMQDANMTKKKVIYVDSSKALEFYFDSFTRRVLGVRISTTARVLASGTYSLKWRYIDSKPKCTLPTLTLAQQNGFAAATRTQIFEITNLLRKTFDLKPLTFCPKVSAVSLLHSKDMQDNKFVSHVSPKLGNLEARFKRAKLNVSFLAENIAYGTLDGAETVFSWLNSEGHRKNLLTTRASTMGVGVSGKFYTQNFIQAK